MQVTTSATHMLLFTGLGDSHLGRSQRVFSIKELMTSVLSDVALVFLYLLHISHIGVMRELTSADTLYDSKTVKEQSVASVPMAVPGLHDGRGFELGWLTSDVCREFRK